MLEDSLCILAKAGLTTLAQATVLVASNARPCTVALLSDILSCPKPRITGAVDRLEELGLVESTLNRADRRQIFVSTTDKGKALVRQVEGWD
jgi:DNA-binding MarR family transcriptional regulator